MTDVWDHSGAAQRWKHLHWQTRWLRLRGQQLHYFKEARDAVPEHIIDLYGAQVIECEGLVLLLRPKDSQIETLKLRFAAACDKEGWRRRLADAAQRAVAGLDADGPRLPPASSRGKVTSYLRSLSSTGVARRASQPDPPPQSDGRGPAPLLRTASQDAGGGTPQSCSADSLGSSGGAIQGTSGPSAREPIPSAVARPPPPPQAACPCSTHAGSPTQSFIQPAELVGWKRGSQLGRGSFGEVWLGLLTNGKFVAVKEIEFGSGAQDDAIAAEIKTELDLMKKLSHPHIVRCFGTQYADRRLSIFLEYIPQGALSKVIKTFGPLQYVTALAYTQQIIDGLVYLHANKVIHRDIKADNVLLDNNGTVKLSDFGCAKELARNSDSATTLVGTPNFIAPEVIVCGKYNAKADVWSLGCTCVEMITGLPPWPQFSTVWAALQHIAESEGPPGLPTDLDPRFHRFLLKCFERDPDKRPSSAELQQLPIIRGCDSVVNVPDLQC